MLSKQFIEFLTSNFKGWSQDFIQKLQQGKTHLNKEWRILILCKASFKGEANIITELFEHYPSKDYINEGNPRDLKRNQSLMYAVAGNQTDIFMLLVRRGASVYRKNLDKETPLAFAYRKNRQTLLNTFFNDPEIPRLAYYDEYGNSIIEYALSTECIEFAQFLVSQSKGPDIHHSLQCPEGHFWTINQVPYADIPLTPILRSIKSEASTITRGLIKIGADLSVRSEVEKLTPFQTLIQARFTGNPNFQAFIQSLIEQSYPLTNSSKDFESDLIFLIKEIFRQNEQNPESCVGYSFDIFQTIVAHYPTETFNHLDQKLKMTALTLAIHYCLEPVVILLLNKGVDPLIRMEQNPNCLTIESYDFQEELHNIELTYRRFIPPHLEGDIHDDRAFLIGVAIRVLYNLAEKMKSIHLRMYQHPVLKDVVAKFRSEIQHMLNSHLVPDISQIIANYCFSEPDRSSVATFTMRDDSQRESHGVLNVSSSAQASNIPPTVLHAYPHALNASSSSSSARSVSNSMQYVASLDDNNSDIGLATAASIPDRL